MPARLEAAVAAARKVAGRVYRALRRRSDILLAPSRRRRAAKRIRALDTPANVLVVCYGNVCRSPYLEALLRGHWPDTRVISAGFIGPGRSVPEHSLTVATRRGVNLRDHRSQLITPEMVRSSDLVLVMDQRQAKVITQRFGVSAGRVVHTGDLDPIGKTDRTILDPWGSPVEIFEECFDRLERCATELVRLVPELSETQTAPGSRPREGR